MLPRKSETIYGFVLPKLWNGSKATPHTMRIMEKIFLRVFMGK
jgi:hypothetical protein